MMRAGPCVGRGRTKRGRGPESVSKHSGEIILLRRREAQSGCWLRRASSNSGLRSDRHHPGLAQLRQNWRESSRSAPRLFRGRGFFGPKRASALARIRTSQNLGNLGATLGAILDDIEGRPQNLRSLFPGTTTGQHTTMRAAFSQREAVMPCLGWDEHSPRRPAGLARLGPECLQPP